MLINIIRLVIISCLLYAISFIILVSSFDADLLLFVVPFICIILAFFINKRFLKKLLIPQNNVGIYVNTSSILKIKKTTFIKIFPFSLLISIPFIYWLADTSYFSYGNQYGSSFHLLNGRDFISTPSINGWIFIIISSFIFTYLLIYLYRGVKYIFQNNKRL